MGKLLTTRRSKSNPKALNLTGLEKLKKKVTVGFKCDPLVKLQLAKEAQKIGITLSEYVESLLLELQNAVQLERMEMETLNQKLSFYENPILLKWFKEYKGQKVDYTNNEGNTISIKIKAPQDIYTVIINSFKLKK